jgi:hypothetical protein
MSAPTILAFTCAIVLVVLLIAFFANDIGKYLDNRKERKAARKRNQAHKEK